MSFKRIGWWLMAAGMGAGGAWEGSSVWAAESGDQVVVVYNTRSPDSKAVALHYAERRRVPERQVLGFDLPESEAISRSDYVKRLEGPLREALRERELWQLGAARPLSKLPGGVDLKCEVGRSKFRYLALCYGVPTTILKDPELRENMADLPPNLARNEASVDSELSCLPLAGYRRAGPLPNPYYTLTNGAWLHPTNGVLLVSRLDGPSAAIAKGLVDRAMMTETNGLWGRGYFDARGLREGGYLRGDEWIRGAAAICKAMGFETELDDDPETFPASYPMSHIAFYAGWYDANVSGPLARPQVEFMPGAIGYHLHSFSAKTIRSTTERWVGPLLSKGVTATMGSVDEPYLAMTPDVSVLFGRLLYYGFSFGEAALAAQAALSWQILAVGDPLYRPFAVDPRELHLALARRGSGLLQWSHLRVTDLHSVRGTGTEEVLDYIRSIPQRHASSVLMEKTAELYLGENHLSDALSAYERALAAGPSPQQKVRLMLRMAALAEQLGEKQRGYDTYVRFLDEVPDYPDRLLIYRKLLPLAKSLEQMEVVARCEREIALLTQ